MRFCDNDLAKILEILPETELEARPQLPGLVYLIGSPPIYLKDPEKVVAGLLAHIRAMEGQQ